MERIIITREAGLFDSELYYWASSIYTHDENTYWNKSLDKAIESCLKGLYDVDFIISQTPHTKKARVFKPGVKYTINFKVNKITQYYGVYSGGLENSSRSSLLKLTILRKLASLNLLIATSQQKQNLLSK